MRRGEPNVPFDLHVGINYSGAGTAAATGANVRLAAIAVFGTHGLNTPDRGDGIGGVLASDAIKDIASRFCPKLNSAGVQATSLSIPQLVFEDRTFPYDAFLECNKYHLWELSVWEGKTLTYRPLDLTDYGVPVELLEVDLAGDIIAELTAVAAAA